MIVIGFNLLPEHWRNLIYALLHIEDIQNTNDDTSGVFHVAKASMQVHQTHEVNLNQQNDGGDIELGNTVASGSLVSTTKRRAGSYDLFSEM